MKTACNTTSSQYKSLPHNTNQSLVCQGTKLYRPLHVSTFFLQKIRIPLLTQCKRKKFPTLENVDQIWLLVFTPYSRTALMWQDKIQKREEKRRRMKKKNQILNMPSISWLKDHNSNMRGKLQIRESSHFDEWLLKSQSVSGLENICIYFHVIHKKWICC